MIDSETLYLRSSPSFDNLPAFSWEGKDSLPHKGQPKIFNFDWIKWNFDQIVEKNG